MEIITQLSFCLWEEVGYCRGSGLVVISMQYFSLIPCFGPQIPLSVPALCQPDAFLVLSGSSWGIVQLSCTTSFSSSSFFSPLWTHYSLLSTLGCYFALSYSLNSLFFCCYWTTLIHPVWECLRQKKSLPLLKKVRRNGRPRFWKLRCIYKSTLDITLLLASLGYDCRS